MAWIGRWLLALALVAGGSLGAAAQEAPANHVLSKGGSGKPKEAAAEHGTKKAGDSDNASGPGVLTLLPPDSITEHTLDLGGRKLPYTATAGTLDLFGQSGGKIAGIFYTSYVAKNAGEHRPLTFVFNGGPGAASAFLHLGLVGPKILDFGPSGRDGADAKLRDNPQSWIEFTDLVLIDPISTGWSRTAKADDASNFLGVRQDAESIAKAIALYVSHNARSASPKYLVGESYGGFRAVKVAQALQEDQGLIVSGIVMLSPLLEGPLQFGASKFALGAALQFPSLAAAELERNKMFTPQRLADAEKFALTTYLTTLAGPPPSGTAADAFYGKVAAMTGLPIDVVRRTRGFVHDAYGKHLREAEQSIVSSYDVNLAAPDPYPESDSNRSDDPVLDGFARAYGGAFVGYARDELGFKTEMTYTLLANDVNRQWDWGNGPGKGTRSQISVSDDIKQLLSLNPSFRVLIAHGFSDLVTPYAVNKYVVEHLPQADAADRVKLNVYRGGHMFYTVPASRIQFTADARAFYDQPRKPATTE